MGKIDAQRIDFEIPNSPDRPCFVIHPSPGQTANLVEFRNQAGEVVTAIGPDGEVINPTASNFADLETPVGIIDGINDTFTLQHPPSPAASLHLYRNGLLLTPGGEDYTLTGDVIVYVAGAIPNPGDVHKASYRY